MRLPGGSKVLEVCTHSLKMWEETGREHICPQYLLGGETVGFFMLVFETSCIPLYLPIKIRTQKGWSFDGEFILQYGTESSRSLGVVVLLLSWELS